METATLGVTMEIIMAIATLGVTMETATLGVTMEIATLGVTMEIATLGVTMETATLGVTMAMEILEAFHPGQVDHIPTITDPTGILKEVSTILDITDQSIMEGPDITDQSIMEAL